MAKTTSQKHAALRKLAKDVRKNIYEMLVLAAEILDDHEYVDAFGGEGQLIDELESREFAHFGGTPELATMLRAYRAHPEREQWEEYDYNVQAMIELIRPAREPSTSERVNWKARCAELEEELAKERTRVSELREMLKQLLAREETAVGV